MKRDRDSGSLSFLASIESTMATSVYLKNPAFLTIILKSKSFSNNFNYLKP